MFYIITDNIVYFNRKKGNKVSSLDIKIYNQVFNGIFMRLHLCLRKDITVQAGMLFMHSRRERQCDYSFDNRCGKAGIACICKS